MCYDVSVSTRLHITVSEGLVARIDAARGPGQPRADWVRRAVERALEANVEAESSPPAEQPIIAELRAEELRRVSPPKPIPPRVPSPEPEIPAAVHERFRALSPRRDVKPFQRGDK